MDKTRITLRLPEDLAIEAAQVAEGLGISLNAFIVLGVRNWVSYQRKQLGTRANVSGSQGLPRPAKQERQQVNKVGPNQPCPCGSGQKYKRCHGKPGT